MRKRVTFEADDVKLFDTLRAIGGNTDGLGGRMVSALLSEPTMAELIGMEVFGVTYIGHDDATERYRIALEQIKGLSGRQRRPQGWVPRGRRHCRASLERRGAGAGGHHGGAMAGGEQGGDHAIVPAPRPRQAVPADVPGVQDGTVPFWEGTMSTCCSRRPGSVGRIRKGCSR